MNTTATKLIAIVSLSVIGLATSNASACPKGGYGGGFSSYNNHHSSYYVKKIYVAPPVYHCYRPFHCFAWVLPGDTWATISLREYGNLNLFPSIASFNGMSLSLPLVVGQQIRLPEIHPNNVVLPSAAPSPAPFVMAGQPVGVPVTQNLLPQTVNSAPFNGSPMTNGSPVVSQNFVNAPLTNGSAQAAPMFNNASASVAPIAPVTSAAPVMNAVPSATIRPASAEPTIPSVAIGSTLVLDGQSLGEGAGVVRLRLSGLALKAEVIEWTAGSVKIRLPELDITSAMPAELEVLRADGSLASKSALQLTPAATKLAQGN